MATSEKFEFERYQHQEAELRSEQDGEEQRERREKRSVMMLVIASILFLLAALTYTKTPSRLSLPH
jgi:hypothetical protein